MKTQDPSAEQLQSIINLYNQGQFQEALNESTQMLQSFPKSIVLNNIIGATNAALMRFDEAILCYKQALKINPQYADAYYNMGNAIKDQGDLDSAIDCYKQALKINPHYAEAYNNMGASHKDQGDLDSAIDCYKQALKINPHNPEIHNNIGNAIKDQGDLDSAIDCYKQALKINPHYAEAYVNLCEIYEQANKLSDLREVISEGKASLVEVPEDVLLYEALYYFRKKNFERSQKLVGVVKISKLSIIKRPLFIQLKAKLHHQNKNYDLAFNSFAEMNGLVMKSADYNQNHADVFFRELIDKRLQLEAISNNPFSHDEPKSSKANLVFLVGFPRSGTTLLDTILRTHSKIEVVEEKQMLLRVQEHLGNKVSILEVENLTKDEQRVAREIYFKELTSSNLNIKSSFVIDKLPLNILDIPIIHKLFPNSKFILALRHPLDSILSCWMQLFALNPAMANMLELHRIVDFYNEAMNILDLSDKRYPLDMHKIKYEDVVVDMKLQVSNLLTFLGLEWEESLQLYNETALRRGLVGTPSYSQVIQPIYKSASFRWQKYRLPLEKYFSKIEKWTTKFDYDL